MSPAADDTTVAKARAKESFADIFEGPTIKAGESDGSKPVFPQGRRRSLPDLLSMRRPSIAPPEKAPKESVLAELPVARNTQVPQAGHRRLSAPVLYGEMTKVGEEGQKATSFKLTLKVAIVIQDMIMMELTKPVFKAKVRAIFKVKVPTEDDSDDEGDESGTLKPQTRLLYQLYCIHKGVLARLGLEDNRQGVEKVLHGFTHKIIVDPEFKKRSKRLAQHLSDLVTHAQQEFNTQPTAEGLARQPGTRKSSIPGGGVVSVSALALIGAPVADCRHMNMAPFESIPTDLALDQVERQTRELDDDEESALYSASDLDLDDSDDDADDDQRVREAQARQKASSAAKKAEKADPDAGRRNSFVAEPGRHWKVVGGTSTGGLLVRKGVLLSSPQLQGRLHTGSVVEEIGMSGDRLHYERMSGEGPDFGWVSVLAQRTFLLEPLDGDGNTVMGSMDPYERLRHLTKGRSVK